MTRAGVAEVVRNLEPDPELRSFLGKIGEDEDPRDVDQRPRL